MLATRDWGVPDRARTAIGVTMFVVVYFAIASVSLVKFGISTPIWFSNAVAVVWLLAVKRRRWPFYIAALYLADTTAIHFFGGQPAPVLALADVAEVVMVALLVRRFGGAAAALTSVAGLARFVLIAIAVPLLSSAWGAGVLWWAGQGTFWTNFWPWYSGVSLGMLVACPSLMILSTPALHDWVGRVETAIMLLLIAVLAILVSGLENAAFLLITFPALLMLVWRAGLIGASLGSVILLAVGLWRTFAQQGAFAALALPATSLQSNIVALQIYLAALTLSSLPLAVVLAEQRRLARELLRVAEARSEFLAAMSHEIRTPMTGVLGMVDLIDAEQPTPRQRKQLASIRSAGGHLLSVLNDILDFSRIESGRIELEQTDFSLPSLLEQVQSSLAPMAHDRGIELRVGLTEKSPPVVRGDPTRIRQILLNLGGNAIKFTPKGSVVILATYRRPGEESRFRFDVRDTGIGLAPEQQFHIFDAFTQADLSTTRRYGGSGLGLAISKRLVEAMGGEIGVESVPGEGSLFWFDIPLELGDIANISSEGLADAPALAPRRVLLAEDVELNRDIIRAILERDGHIVAIAENGREAVMKLRQQRFDLVLMDVHMPVMDGLEATRAIRALPGPAGATPIVALTANVMATEQEKCHRAGMDSVLMKPINWDQVRAVIAQYPAMADESHSVPVSENDPAFNLGLFDELATMVPPERLERYVQTLRSDAESLAEAVQGEPGVADLAHGIVSQAGMLGLMRLSSRAAAVEQACESQAEFGEAIERFREACPDIAEQLLVRLNAPPTLSPNTPSQAATGSEPGAASG